MASSMFSVKGHTAVVTGCTRGIGQAVAIGLAEAGADIILVQVRWSSDIRQGLTSNHRAA